LWDRPVDGEAEALTRKAVEMALAGDVMALKLCLERLVPPRKERPLSFALPPIASAEDTEEAIGGVLAALGQGLVSLSEAREAIDLIERCRRIIGPALPAQDHAIQIQFVSAS
jgi:hypothetical protein